MHLHSQSCSLLTSFLSAMVGTSAGSQVEKARGIMIQKICWWNSVPQLQVEGEEQAGIRNMNKWRGFSWGTPPVIYSGWEPEVGFYGIRKKTTFTAAVVKTSMIGEKMAGSDWACSVVLHCWSSSEKSLSPAIPFSNFAVSLVPFSSFVNL